VLFRDIDRAIEWAEDHLLAAAEEAAPSSEELPLEKIGTLRHFEPKDIAVLRGHLKRKVYRSGDMVFRQGDPGRELFLVTRGTASAFLDQNDGHNIRLATFAPGTVFGELAILDKGPRSASIAADTELTCHSLSDEGFAALSVSAPAVAIKLLQNLGHELSGRLRRANQAISQLEG
jgi:SulP family sulfate permease